MSSIFASDSYPGRYVYFWPYLPSSAQHTSMSSILPIDKLRITPECQDVFHRKGILVKIELVHGAVYVIANHLTAQRHVSQDLLWQDIYAHKTKERYSFLKYLVIQLGFL